ncbi:hypothetical protein DFP72DRAFT_846708 [Ephemerocybe angulata]|uniref:Uncharacterized protein n=1 Tax=Ephemerocybe angulata TaxID=980116 RepID=A0A8H6M6A7_9AGAR|nr:hypothetical protein DFP72DRAFT_846708 [Tulosesus angulatus]
MHHYQFPTRRLHVHSPVHPDLRDGARSMNAASDLSETLSLQDSTVGLFQLDREPRTARAPTPTAQGVGREERATRWTAGGADASQARTSTWVSLGSHAQSSRPDPPPPFPSIRPPSWTQYRAFERHTRTMRRLGKGYEYELLYTLVKQQLEWMKEERIWSRSTCQCPVPAIEPQPHSTPDCPAPPLYLAFIARLNHRRLLRRVGEKRIRALEPALYYSTVHTTLKNQPTITGLGDLTKEYTAPRDRNEGDDGREFVKPWLRSVAAGLRVRLSKSYGRRECVCQLIQPFSFEIQSHQRTKYTTLGSTHPPPPSIDRNTERSMSPSTSGTQTMTAPKTDLPPFSSTPYLYHPAFNTGLLERGNKGELHPSLRVDYSKSPNTPNRRTYGRMCPIVGGDLPVDEGNWLPNTFRRIRSCPSDAQLAPENVVRDSDESAFDLCKTSSSINETPGRHISYENRGQRRSRMRIEAGCYEGVRPIRRYKYTTMDWFTRHRKISGGGTGLITVGPIRKGEMGTMAEPIH